VGIKDFFKSRFGKSKEEPVINTTDTVVLDDGMSGPQLRASGLAGGSTIILAKEMQDYLRGASQRIRKYSDYHEMEFRLSMVSVALDMYADYTVNGGEAEAHDTYRVQIPKYQEVLDLGFKRTKFKDASWSTVRSLCQFGDQFGELVDDTIGLCRIKAAPCDQMYRQEDQYGRLHRFVQNVPTSGEVLIDPWQMVHWRLLVDPTEMYGRSVLYGALRAARELGLVEDSATLARLTKGVQRFKWEVDIGRETDPDRQKEILTRAKLENRHDIYMNSDGSMGGTTNLLRATEDLFVPKTSDGVADVTVVPGDKGVGNVNDLEHKRDAVFMALRFPKSWYGLHGGSLTRADVDQSAVNAFRAVRRIRNAFSEGLRQLVKHSLVVGIPKISLEETEDIADQAKILYPHITHSDLMLRAQIDKLLLELASMYEDTFLLSREDILVKVLRYDPGEVAETLERADEDAKKRAELAATAQQGGGPMGNPVGFPGKAAKDSKKEDVAKTVRQAIDESPRLQGLVKNVKELTDITLNL